MDPDMREEISDVQYADAVTVKAQMEYRQGRPGEVGDEIQISSPSGVTLREKGYALFRVRDLEAAGLTLKAGDTIVAIQARTLTAPLHITSLQHVAHYSPWGSTLIKAHFAERQPLA